MEIIIKEKTLIKTPKQIAKILQSILNAEEMIDRDKEHFWAIGLNANNIINYIELVSLGTVNTNLVHPREVFRFAIMKGVTGILVGHNHPSGNLQPSASDIVITTQLKKAGEILGIPLLDHIIISQENYISLNEGDKKIW